MAVDEHEKQVKINIKHKKKGKSLVRTSCNLAKKKTKLQINIENEQVSKQHLELR